MLKKNAEFVWTDQCEQTFKQIKNEIASNRIFAHFDPNAQTIVSTDESCIALGGVLSQIHRPLAFASKSLQTNEKAYSLGER